MEVSAYVRRHLPGCTEAQYCWRCVEGTRELASGTVPCIGLGDHMRRLIGWSPQPVMRSHLAAGPHDDP
ncbi:hypothetical protein Sm713_67720 [Streptomyces sp. TS71-3]|nr:hypothetical protein Sm713_67720 [Streptomyces sp. TS71-3]